ncbi:MAG TPA: type IV-A pilus assembly ATPase PilB [Polyangia bacterium]|jgi:type IV pilus assembly protein PilB|nr:type IV-A pilus assembly ATPase PilB [Polyangia bacterium]
MSRLGELLVKEQVISADQLQKAQETSKRSREPLRDSLIKLGAVKEDDLTQFLAKQYGVIAVNLAEFDIEAEIIGLVPKDVARKHHVVPVNRADKTLIVAMSDPSNIQALDDLKFLTGYNIEVAVASEVSITEALNKYYEEKNDALNFNLDEMLNDIDEDVEYAKDDSEQENVLDLERASEDAPVVKLCNAILLNAIKQGASDIHIEPYEKSYRVRYRVDGVLHEEMTPPLKLKAALTSRMKIMAHLDIAERRLPQDGRIKLKIGRGKEMDFRVSVLPTLFGEKIVMRLLDKGNLQLDMTKLGFEAGQLAIFKKAIEAPFGMILVTGPTGSGKTTTLYSALQELNQISDNISTAEDPVEFNLAGINQVQMHDDIGLNFAAALRSFLRQDPDTIMIGEIRDFETAEIAVKAALTGHMVLSTLHTNDAPSTITRLLNMGVEPFLVTASVNLVEAQRLIRKICAGCKEPIPTPKDELRNLGAKDEEIDTATCFKGAGCNVCGGSGYKGRIAVYEVMTFIDPLKELVLQGASGAELKAEAIRNGMRTLRMSGVSKVCAGVSSFDEVARITAAD